MTLRTAPWILFLILALAACRAAIPAGVLPTATNPSISTPVSTLSTTTAGITPGTLPTASLPTVTKIAPGVVLPTLAPPMTPSITAGDYPGPLYEKVFSIPVGENGVQYKKQDQPGGEIVGPNALAALFDGSFFIADPVTNRLLHYSSNGEQLGVIDLASKDILNVSDLVADGRDLFVLEISINAPSLRYRIDRLTSDGNVITSYEIPEGLHLENGLSGIAVDGKDRLLLEVEGGARVYPLAGRDGDYRPVARGGYWFCGWQYLVEYPGSWAIPRLYADHVAVETHLTQKMGSLRFLYAWPDCSFYVVREDILGDQTSPLIDQTVHYLNPAGQQVAVARYPMDEKAYSVTRSMAVGVDGAIYALLPRQESLDVVRLMFYKSLPPLNPQAAEPLVVSVP